MSTQALPVRPADGALWLSLALKTAVIYVGVVFAGGTLVHSGHDGAQRIGVALHRVTMINPLIRWADAHDHDGMLHVLLTIADGVPKRG